MSVHVCSAVCVHTRTRPVAYVWCEDAKDAGVAVHWRRGTESYSTHSLYRPTEVPERLKYLRETVFAGFEVRNYNPATGTK